LIDGNEIRAEAGDAFGTFWGGWQHRKRKQGRACGLFWAERALPAGVRGPVERAALGQLAASRFSDTGLLSLGDFDLGIRMSCSGFGRRNRLPPQKTGSTMAGSNLKLVKERKRILR
jgi:hypothetical protein